MHSAILLLLLHLTVLATARTPSTYGWFSLGCWVDNPSRLLQPVFVTDNSLTVEACLTRCSAYKYAMVENTNQCFCGNKINGGNEVPMSECNQSCVGDASQGCGGVWRAEIYEMGAKAWCLGGTGKGITSEQLKLQLQEL